MKSSPTSAVKHTRRRLGWNKSQHPPSFPSNIQQVLCWQIKALYVLSSLVCFSFYRVTQETQTFSNPPKFPSQSLSATLLTFKPPSFLAWKTAAVQFPGNHSYSPVSHCPLCSQSDFLKPKSNLKTLPQLPVALRIKAKQLTWFSRSHEVWCLPTSSCAMSPSLSPLFSTLICFQDFVSS